MSKQKFFDKKIRELFARDVKTKGSEWLLSIPGIWEILSDFYNNEAMQSMEEDSE